MLPCEQWEAESVPTHPARTRVFIGFAPSVKGVKGYLCPTCGRVCVRVSLMQAHAPTNTHIRCQCVALACGFFLTIHTLPKKRKALFHGPYSGMGRTLPGFTPFPKLSGGTTC
jgi:hypothetical protein